jgi:menaquinone-9 beta-reductase
MSVAAVPAAPASAPHSADLVLSLKWDAIVIGAGPAGAIAARELARLGARVLLVDKAAFPRSKVCGCCLNGAALAALDSIGLGHVPSVCGAVPLHEVKLTGGGRSADLRLPAGAALSREAFDLTLVQEAQAAGAVFAPNTPVKFERGSVTGGNGRTVDARIAILANGLAASHSVLIGSRIGGGTIVAGDRVPAFFTKGVIFMATGRGGYVGLVRLEDDRLDVAAAFDAGFVRMAGGLGRAAESIVAPTGWPAIADLADLPWKGTPALTRSATTIAGPRFFAVGDAAGYVEPFTGEGMAWAIASAAALAPIAYKAANEWQFRYINDWRRTHARIVSERQVMCRLAARVLRSPRLTGIVVRMLSFAPALARPAVALLNRPVYHPGFTT